MAHRRQQHRPARQRSPGAYGPPPKRPRTAAPLPPLPPLEWDQYDYDRAPRSRYPTSVYDDYDRMPDYPPPRATRREYSQFRDEEFYGDYRAADRRPPPRRPQPQRPQPQRPQPQRQQTQRQQPQRQQVQRQQPPRQQSQHQQPYRQERQQYNQYRHQQHVPSPQRQRGGGKAGGGGGRGMRQRGPPAGSGGADQWNDRRRQYNKNKRPSGPRKHSPARHEEREEPTDKNGSAIQRNWTKTYWFGKSDNLQKRHTETFKRSEIVLPEATRFYILCSMIKSKFRHASLFETFEYFLNESVVRLAPAFTFKRQDGQTTCKFYVNKVCVSEGKALTRSEAKKRAVDSAAAVMDTESPETILSTHEEVDVSKLGEDEVDAVDKDMLSHLEKYTGEKPLDNFVILQTEGWAADKWNWTSILVQSAAFSRMELHFQLKGQDHKRVICDVQIDGKFIYSGRARLVKEAKNSAAKGAVAELQKKCYTLVIKDGTKVAEKNMPSISVLETTGSMSSGLSEEEFRSKVAAMLEKYLEEEDVTKPLVLSTDGLSTEEHAIIIEVSKSMHLVQRNEEPRRPKKEEEKKEGQKGDSKKNGKKEGEKVGKKDDGKKTVNEESVEKKKDTKQKEEKKESDKSAKTKKNEEKSEDNGKEDEEMKEENKDEEVKEENKDEEMKEENKDEEDEKKEDEEQTGEEKEKEVKSTEKNDEEAEKVEKEDEEEKKDGEKNEEEDTTPRIIVLIRKYSGIDMLEYVLNKDSETWKYKAIAPGAQAAEEAESMEGQEEQEANAAGGEASEAKDAEGTATEGGEAEGEEAMQEGAEAEGEGRDAVEEGAEADEEGVEAEEEGAEEEGVDALLEGAEAEEEDHEDVEGEEDILEEEGIEAEEDGEGNEEENEGAAQEAGEEEEATE